MSDEGLWTYTCSHSQLEKTESERQINLSEGHREDPHLSPSCSQEDPLHLASPSLLSLLAQGHLGAPVCPGVWAPAAPSPSQASCWQCLAHHRRGLPHPIRSWSWSLLSNLLCQPPSQLQTENPRRWSAFLADVSPSQPGTGQRVLERPAAESGIGAARLETHFGGISRGRMLF